MAAHRLTSKGQVTIPKAMRDAIGLRPGDVVEFEQDGEKLFIARAKYERPEDHPLIRHLRASGKHFSLGMTTDEYMRLTRGED